MGKVKSRGLGNKVQLGVFVVSYIIFMVFVLPALDVGIGGGVRWLTNGFITKELLWYTFKRQILIGVWSLAFVFVSFGILVSRGLAEKPDAVLGKTLMILHTMVLTVQACFIYAMLW